MTMERVDSEVGHSGYVSKPDFKEYRQRVARRDRFRKLLSGAAGIVAALVLWQVISEVYNLKLLLPTPWTTVMDFFKVITVQSDPWPYGGNLYTHVAASMAHAGIGFGASATLGIPLGLIVGRVRWLRESLGVVLKLLYPVPGVAWIPLTILWFGLNSTAIVFVVAITSFFPLYYTTEAGSRYVDASLVDMARCLSLKNFRLVTKVIIPASLPHIITGLRLSVGEAWRTLVAAEIIAGQTGIGYILHQSQLFFIAPDLLSFMLVISLIGYGSQLLIAGTIERRTILRWGVGGDTHSN